MDADKVMKKSIIMAIELWEEGEDDIEALTTATSILALLIMLTIQRDAREELIDQIPEMLRKTPKMFEE